MSDSPVVLIVDDDPDIRESLELGLTMSGFVARTAADGAAALAAVTSKSGACVPDAMVLDVNMPDLDGVSVVTALRAVGVDIPICMLSARTDVRDRVSGLEAGADDYLVKPFDLDELVARLRALLRRPPATTANSQVSQTHSVGRITIDLAGRQVRDGAVVVDLTKREFDLLAALTANAGIALSRNQLLETVWGYDFEAQTNVVDVFVGYLRRKLEERGAPRVIQTVRGYGFVLRAEP